VRDTKVLMLMTAAATMLLASAAGAGEAPRKTAELLRKGKESFAVNCASCHGDKGAGDGPAAAALDPKPRNLATDPLRGGSKPAQLFATLGKGVPSTAMIAFSHLPEEELWALAYYVAELRGGAKAAPKGQKK